MAIHVPMKAEATTQGRPLRIGVNALYFIPGGVGGTEVYLRSLLSALAKEDRRNHYFVMVNLETDVDLVPCTDNFTLVREPIRAAFRPLRLAWEQVGLPLECVRLKIGRYAQSGIHGSNNRPVPASHRISRPAVSTPSGIHTLVRLACVSSAYVPCRANLEVHHSGLRSHIG